MPIKWLIHRHNRWKSKVNEDLFSIKQQKKAAVDVFGCCPAATYTHTHTHRHTQRNCCIPAVRLLSAESSAFLALCFYLFLFLSFFLSFFHSVWVDGCPPFDLSSDSIPSRVRLSMSTVISMSTANIVDNVTVCCRSTGLHWLIIVKLWKITKNPKMGSQTSN